MESESFSNGDLNMANIYANVPWPSEKLRLPIFSEASKEHCRFQSTPSFRLQQFARIPWQISPWQFAKKLSRWPWWSQISISLSMMIQEWNKLGCWNLQWTKHVFTSWYFNILTIVLESSWFIKHDHGHHFFCPGTLLPCWMGWRPQTQNLALPLKIIAPHTPRDPGTSNSLDQAWPWNSMNFGIEKGVRKSPWEVSVEKDVNQKTWKITFYMILY